ncbi:hypothetical protein GUJ93_ZPchr0014g46840 [Zizania palustris]|uniref:DUF7597 domain-containing protein n=1 Tax=Zizania palustris TaxID=103762 RepID=A0A8J5TH05_ZIZPA|nr:hypothetical protein GUJ93_ZPchr0014g46840 [Zizania palustris]
MANFPANPLPFVPFGGTLRDGGGPLRRQRNTIALSGKIVPHHECYAIAESDGHIPPAKRSDFLIAIHQQVVHQLLLRVERYSLHPSELGSSSSPALLNGTSSSTLLRSSSSGAWYGTSKGIDAPAAPEVPASSEATARVDPPAPSDAPGLVAENATIGAEDAPVGAEDTPLGADLAAEIAPVVAAPTVEVAPADATLVEGVAADDRGIPASLSLPSFVPGRGKSISSLGLLPGPATTSAGNSEDEAAADDHQALSWLPLLAPFLEQREGLRRLMEPLAEKSQDIVNSDLVSVLSEARASTLNTALERAALQQFVLARAAATSNEVEINRLKRKVTTLQTALNDSNERSIKLEEETLVERRARAASDEALRIARQDSDALRSSTQEVEAERVVLRAEVERLRQAAAASSAQLVELQGALNQAMAQKSSLMLQVAEVSATAAGLEAAEKNSVIAERTLEALQGTLEYFGTMCPSSSAATLEPLDQKLKRIQVASSLMMNSGIRYGEISGQCAGIGVLRHLESLQIPLGSVGGSTPGSFASDDLLRPSSDVAFAWEAFRSTWKTDHKVAAKAWIDEARRQKQAQTRPPLPASPAPVIPAPPTDPQV